MASYAQFGYSYPSASQVCKLTLATTFCANYLLVRLTKISSVNSYILQMYENVPIMTYFLHRRIVRIFFIFAFN